ncbi:chitin elicitor receptor kinase 1 [Actinidia rufa]|uniref:Chitin elicitor receptor kinase 1 n=1 Tax=Actinidia rufa TaxID=165716 RepID=A0A7J0G6D6_9ERIC|nr:chitin elicitor receptor kinase 1 [Actinidia rufa]
MYDPTQIPDFVPINVTVNCSCGDRHVSVEYGLFTTYPLREGENLSSVAAESGVLAEVIRRYNPRSDFGAGSGLVFVPAKDQNGTYPPFKSSSSGGITGGVIAGISVAGVAGALLLAVCFYAGLYRRKKGIEGSFLRGEFDDHGQGPGSSSTLEKTSESGPLMGGVSLQLTGITVDKSVEFSYEELAKATNDFSLANKIGQGGFGAVYYGELRGEKTAIKKMDMLASKEFLAELESFNACSSLKLGKDPLPWSVRVQIALDSARGLEYIHEHTVPVYIHRDIKSANILIDQNFRAKVVNMPMPALVADFGLTKLTEFGSASLHTRLVGTFGYMSPE